MKLNNLACRTFVFSLLSSSAWLHPAYAATSTPANQDSLRIHTGMPKKTNDSLFSYTIEWQMDEGKLYHSTGLSFLNAKKIDPAAPAAQIAKKLVTAMKDGMTQLHPDWRGITIEQPQDQAELNITNKAGYSLANITVKDYSNQALRYDVGGQRFNSAGVKIAIDLVLAADVEYLDNFSAKKSQTASEGDITIVIDDQKPIKIKTDGKTTRQLEQEIANQLSTSQLSETPLVAGVIDKDKRNNKPFDGSEVQLLNLAAKSIAIDITDPALGVLTKFKFKNEAASAKVAEPRFMMAVLGLIGFLAVGYLWRKNAKKVT